MVVSLAIITVSAQTVNLCIIEQGKLREVRIPLENLGAAGMLLEPRHWDWASKDPLPRGILSTEDCQIPGCLKS